VISGVSGLGLDKLTQYYYCMLETLITIAIVGIITGIIFSIPVAGPISILITSNALKGRFRYCYRVAIGASIVEFIYVFIAVYGFTILYSYYRPVIPYIFLIGSIFLLFVGIRIIKTKLNLENIDDKDIITNKLKNRGGLRTGLILNFTNPSLFIGWVASSFIVLSFVASLGFNTGGLDVMVSENVDSINYLNESISEITKKDSIYNDVDVITKEKNVEQDSAINPILLSLCYAFFVAIGGFIWAFYFSKFIVKHRKIFNVNIINRIIQMLGVILCIMGLYFAFHAFKTLAA
jgi:threonine/homoserine/homoserine lactone efflux protein